ncbi:MAG: ABC transporter permease [Candidatus Zixiibacteriota bacterium]|nr:MAG: ABC transporter permease [candidate division Zixibacteria bacterium]
MLLNYLRITLRNIRKYKGYTLVNLAGLAISLACCILIGLWILNEKSYDKHYADVDRVQAILTNGHFVSANALAPYLEENVPEIQYAARTTGSNEILVNSESLDSFERLMAADPQVLQILSFPFIAGDPKTALSKPNSVVITEEMAAKFFGNQPAIGKTLSIDNRAEYVVTGVIENIPPNSSFQFDLLVSIDYQRQEVIADGFPYEAWNFVSTKTVAKVQPGVTTAALTDKISGLIQQFYDDREVSLAAINIGDLYLRFSETNTGIKIFSSIALAILLMACINYVNLSTARFRMRAKETGIRKIIGASRGALIAQFLGESFVLITVGFALALCLVDTSLPFFNSLFELRLSLNLLGNPSIIMAGIAIIIATTLAAGIYPAVVLSRFHPVQTIRTGLNQTNRHFTLRRVLVVLQFSLTAILIIGTAVIYTQVNHMKNWDVGYNKEHVVNIRLRGDSRKQYPVLKNKLRQSPEILAVTAATNTLPYWYMETSVTWDDLEPDEQKDVAFNFVRFDFTDTYGIEVTEGRSFNENIATDEQFACLVNETLARSMNRSPVLGSHINVWNVEREIVGIVKDFNFRPLNSGIQPLVLTINPAGAERFGRINVMSIRIGPNNISSTLASIEKTWNAIIPNHPFEYTFLDEQFDANYRSLEQVNNLAVCFGTLAIFIAALGLFGLASYTAEQKTKEIGIRKVLGASITNIVRMMSREYVILVAVANLIAWPLAWFIMSDWLSEFAYHIDVSVGTYVMVGCFTLLIALLSVGYQAIRAANTNPVDAIQYE